MKPTLLALALALALPASTVVHAQDAAPSTQKQKLVDRVLELWRVEDTAVVMVQRPAADALNQARVALQGRVTADKQEATLKQIAGDVQKYIDEATPIARASAQRLKQPTLAPLLMAQFSEDELRQLVALLESPVKRKFEQLVPQLERTYGERVAADSGRQIDARLQAMTQSVGLKLRAAALP